MYKVFTMEYWYTREILERAVNEVEILAVRTHAWIGMKAGKHWVAIALGLNVQRRYNSDRDYE